MSRIRIYAEASLPIVVVLLFLGGPSIFGGALFAVIEYPDLWLLPLIGYAVSNACFYLFMYLILSNQDWDGLDIALLISITSLPYSGMTSILLSVLADPINYVLLAVGIAAPVIGFGIVLWFIFRIRVRHLTELYSSSEAVGDRPGRE